MELYTTKKLYKIDDFCLAPHNTLPSMHIITPEIILQTDINDNIYIAECPSDPSCISNLLKIKKLLCKQEFNKTDEDKSKMMDDIIWVKPSQSMQYKQGSNIVTLNKMLLNRPVKLQLSCKTSVCMYNISKPYNVHNMFWIIDYVIVDAEFDWNA
jgi:hypothetical protein